MKALGIIEQKSLCRPYRLHPNNHGEIPEVAKTW